MAGTEQQELWLQYQQFWSCIAREFVWPRRPELEHRVQEYIKYCNDMGFSTELDDPLIFAITVMTAAVASRDQERKLSQMAIRDRLLQYLVQGLTPDQMQTRQLDEVLSSRIVDIMSKWWRTSVAG